MESKVPVRRKSCLYLYGVFRAGPSELSGVRGIEGECDLSMVSFRQLAAAVSLVPLSVYNEASLARQVEKLEWIAPRAARHQEVVQQLMRSRAVIPLKFGALCLSRARVREILRANYKQWLSLLDFLTGREEWAVKVYVDQDRLGQAMERKSPAALEQRIPSLSPGEAYFLEKKKRRVVSEQKEQFLMELADAIYEELRSAAVDGRRNRLFDASPSGAQAMILNAAFLVESQKVEAFKAKSEQVEAHYQAWGLSLALSGPWAAYHFCGDLAGTSPREDAGKG